MRSVLLRMKPLLDEIYEEMSGLYEEVERYKREVEGLRREVEKYKNNVDDSAYAESATATPRSEVGVTRRISSESVSNVSDLVGVCPVKEEDATEDAVFNFETNTVKNVVISENEQKCADRKEYFRIYRLKQKELKASKNK
jgi:cell division septum initiation protein DivIVA